MEPTSKNDKDEMSDGESRRLSTCSSPSSSCYKMSVDSDNADRLVQLNLFINSIQLLQQKTKYCIWILSLDLTIREGHMIFVRDLKDEASTVEVHFCQNQRHY
ncbi:unnamed protein product [Mucor hiemalis]